MDPTSCMLDMIVCVQEGDIEEARHCADCLHAWLADGGFPPQVDPSDLDHLSDHDRNIVLSLLQSR